MREAALGEEAHMNMRFWHIPAGAVLAWAILEWPLPFIGAALMILVWEEGLF